MFYLLYLLLIAAISATKVTLFSSDNSYLEIPIKKIHSYSCQLVYVNVYNLTLNASVTDIQVLTPAQANLTFYFSSSNLSLTSSVEKDNAFFTLNFSQINQIPQYSSYEAYVDFDLEIPGSVQNRRVYLIFQHASDRGYYQIKLPYSAMLITQIIGTIFILLLPLNVQYRKYTPFYFNLIASTIYILILIIALYAQYFYPFLWIFELQRAIVGLCSLVCVFIYTQDLLSYIISKSFITMIVAGIIALIIIVCDEFCPVLEDNFILNDIIAIMAAGTFIKFVIIRRFKSSLFPLITIWLFFLTREYLSWKYFVQEYDRSVGIRIIPLFIQIPKILWDEETSLVCSSFGTSKIIAFGLFLSYSKRLDLSLSTHFYRVLNNLLAILCIFFELLFNFLEKDMPQSQVMSVIIFYPLSTLLMLFFANKRGEWAEVWHGSFYDMAVNRSSITRSIDFKDIQNQFGNDLLINTDTSR